MTRIQGGPHSTSNDKYVAGATRGQNNQCVSIQGGPHSTSNDKYEAGSVRGRSTSTRLLSARANKDNDPASYVHAQNASIRNVQRQSNNQISSYYSASQRYHAQVEQNTRSVDMGSMIQGRINGLIQQSQEAWRVGSDIDPFDISRQLDQAFTALRSWEAETQA